MSFAATAMAPSIAPSPLAPAEAHSSSLFTRFAALRRCARILAEQSSGRMRFAREFIKETMAAYAGAKNITSGSGLPSLAQQIGSVARLFDLETASYLIGTIYTVMIPSALRAKHGVFFTPHTASRRLLALAEAAGVSWSSARVADISCGGGAFLVPVSVKMLASREWASDTEAFSHLKSHLKGFELDRFSAWMAEAFLDAALRLSFPSTQHSFAGHVEVGNSLTRPLASFGTFDLVIGNPPYGKKTLTPKERVKWKRGLYGHANLYGLFTDLAIRLVDTGGVVASVTPASFLGGQYFERLRGLIASEAPPVAIDFLECRQGVFADALQEIVLIALRKGPSSPFAVSFTSLTEGGHAVVVPAGRYSLPSAPERPWLLPRSLEHFALLAQAAHQPFRLRDYGYKVSTGPLVWNRHKPQLSDSRRAKAIPVVWAEAIDARGRGLFSLKASGRNHAPWYLPKGDDPNAIKRECVLVQRTTSKEQRRRIVAAHLPLATIKKHGAVAVENHVNMVAKAGNGESGPSEAALCALLNSAPVDLLFRCISGSTAVSAYELEAIPLPCPRAMRGLEILLTQNASREQLDRFILGLYSGEESVGQTWS
jgi:adenine-specific DNA-methyltransferase